MNTLNLPADFASWTATQKEAILLALAKERCPQGDEAIFVGGDTDMIMLTPIKPPRRVVLDDSTQALREVKERVATRDQTISFDEAVSKHLR